MTTARIPEIQENSLTRDALNALRYYAGGRRGPLAVAAIALAGGLWLGWPSLVAAGIAPILIALAPCAVMCALGLCMNKMTRRSPAGPSSDASAMSSAEQQARLVVHGTLDHASHEDQSAKVATTDEDCCRNTR